MARTRASIEACWVGCDPSGCAGCRWDSEAQGKVATSGGVYGKWLEKGRQAVD